jgi:hypothetical protein
MSAAGYTNRVRTKSEARVVKAQYPQNVVDNYNPLYSSIACNPIFTILNYQAKQKCATPRTSGPTIICGPIVYYDNGSSGALDLYGGGATSEYTVIFNGGNSGQ